MAAYYNEHDPYAAQWLRNLIQAGHIAPGDVDERSIVDVRADDIKSYKQCHFFAGIGVWSHALRGAGWTDDRAVWTGSCPCQPFSTAGKGNGFSDERHLWPELYRLIQEATPITIFGEQVASQNGYTWLDLVQTDLENSDYSFGAIVAPASGFGAPHQRHRTYWVAHSDSERRVREPVLLRTKTKGRIREETLSQAAGGSSVSGLAHSGNLGCKGFSGSGETRTTERGKVSGFWSSADWLYCRDEKYRPVEPGSFPLAHGATSRVGRLRAYGNGIVAPQAEAFISSYLELNKEYTI